MWPTKGPLKPSFAARSVGRGPARPESPAVTIMRQRVGRGAATKVHVRWVTTGPSMPALEDLTPRTVA